MSGSKLCTSLRRINNACFKRHPLLTNVAISCCLAGTSDFIAQRFLQGYKTLDTERMRHMVTYCATSAPLWHLWYNMVDRYIKPSKTWLKVILDQTTVTPLDYLCFFAVFNYVRGDTIDKCKAELNRVYFKALIPDTVFWPFVTFLGYKRIPLRYRFIYFEIFGVIWDTFLSYLKYSNTDQAKYKDIPSEPTKMKNSLTDSCPVSHTTHSCDERTSKLDIPDFYNYSDIEFE